MTGWEGLPCALPRLFADASEVPPSNKAAVTAIRADLVMLFSSPRHSNIELWALQIVIKRNGADGAAFPNRPTGCRLPQGRPRQWRRSFPPKEPQDGRCHTARIGQ